MKKLFFILFALLSFQGFSQTDLDFDNRNDCNIVADIYATDIDSGCEFDAILISSVTVVSNTSFTANIPAQYSLAFVELSDTECQDSFIIRPPSNCGYLVCESYLEYPTRDKVSSCCGFGAYYLACNAINIK